MKKMYKRGLSFLTILAMLLIVSNFNLTASAAATRDPAYWPFSSTSPWNMPLGDGCTFADSTSPVFKPQTGGWFYLQCNSYSHPVFVASASDPVRTVTRYQDFDYSVPYNPPQTATVHIPTNAMPAANTDHHLHIINETHTTVTETWDTRKTPGTDPYTGNFDAVAMVQNSLTDAGIYPSWHGVRAYGGSVLGGLIRKGELTNGIPHAIALVVSNNALNKNGPSGNPYVWPASCADDNYQTAYAGTGNLYMGSLLAIPMSVNLSSLGLTTASYNVAYALQHYGGYITDSMGPGYNSCYAQVEIGAEDELDPNLYNELVAKVAPLLKVVTNNSQTNVGGPGNRVAPTAPPMAVSSPAPTPTPIPTPTPASGWVNVEDTSSSITYAGNAWGTFNDYRFTTGTAHYNNGFDTSQYCQFTFTGTQAKIYGTRYSGGGVPDVYVDGVKRSSPVYGLYPRADRQLIYDTGVLSNGSHTVKIQATQNGDVMDFWFNLDYYSYNSSGTTPAPTPTPTPTPTTTPTPTPTPTSTPGDRDAYSQIEAESYNSMSGIQSETCSEGGQNIGYIENGDYAVYNNVQFGTGASGFTARVASATSGGNIELRLDSLTGTLVGTAAVTGTGGWQNWTTVNCSVSGAAGKHNLYLKFTGGSGALLNVNWFKFTQGSTIYIGEQNSNLSGDDNFAGNVLVAQSAVLSQTATIQSLSLYVAATGSGQLRLGIYDSTGPGGGPGALKAATNSFTAATGWNTQSVVSPVSLSSGTYWLAALPSTNSMGFKADWSTGTMKYYNYTFGAMPGTYSTSPSSQTCHWAFYATLTR